jgi:rhamnosyltransferase
MQQDVVAVVPTFRPGSALLPLVRTLAETMPVIISDDASPCTADQLLCELAAITGVDVTRHSHNRGIARGLNDGLAFAESHGATWLMTVDQDTTITPNYADELLIEAKRRIAAGVQVGAIGAEVIADISGDMRYPLTDTPHGPITEELIQTGTIWSVPALMAAEGFNEEFGIDAVDAAACLVLRQHGHVICVAPGTRINHEIGSAQVVRILGRDVMVTGHSPERRSSILRNRLRLFPAEYAQSPKHAFRTLRRVTLNQGIGLIVEPDRWAKAKGTIRGLRRPKDG